MVKGLRQFLWNAPDLLGWKTNRKIVVIESDDWGSIRIPSKAVHEELIRKHSANYQSVFNQFDTLEIRSDLSSLFEILASVKDGNGNSAVLTTNTIVANPDFEKIRNTKFKNYFYENFLTTYERYQIDGMLNLWKQGIEAKLVRPQFHGREHVHVERWLTELRAGNEILRYAFDCEVFSSDFDFISRKKKNLQTALDFESNEQLALTNSILEDGLKLFEDIFNYKSKTFIATSYTWAPAHEETLAKRGVRYLQGNRAQKIPSMNSTEYKLARHFLGQKNRSGQRYLVRNVFFEPCARGNREIVNECMQRMEYSFMFKRPAIISSHRINFVSKLNSVNYSQNLKQFENLLKRIVMRWPDVEFLSSDQLGLEIENH